MLGNPDHQGGMLRRGTTVGTTPPTDRWDRGIPSGCPSWDTSSKIVVPILWTGTCTPLFVTTGMVDRGFFGRSDGLRNAGLRSFGGRHGSSLLSFPGAARSHMGGSRLVPRKVSLVGRAGASCQAGYAPE